MITKLGIFSLLAGLFTGVLTGISTFMGTEGFWIDLTISYIIGEEKSVSIVELVDVAIVQDSLDYLLFDLPFYGFLIGLAVLLLIMSLFEKRH